MEGCKDPEMMVEKLAKMVRERVRSAHYEGGHFQWYLRTAERTLASGYGNDMDKAVVLTALLKSQGIKSKMAVSAAVYQPSLKTAMLEQFKRIWVVTEAQGKTVYIDPSSAQSGGSAKNIAGKPVFYFDIS